MLAEGTEHTSDPVAIPVPSSFSSIVNNGIGERDESGMLGGRYGSKFDLMLLSSGRFVMMNWISSIKNREMKLRTFDLTLLRSLRNWW